MDEYSRIVDAVYRRLLLRPPDAAGFEQHVAALRSGQETIDSLIEGALRSPEFASRYPGFLREYVPDQTRLMNDCSQHGEVLELLRLLTDAASRHKMVVDVGANGRERSNSYDLLRHFGWRGLLIEANPYLIEGINRDFGGTSFKVEQVAVSDTEGTAKLFLGVNVDVSSLSRDSTASWGDVSGAVDVPKERLAPILRRNGVPHDFDVLSLDIEGEDVKVLDDLILNSEYRPRWVLIESVQNEGVATLSEIGVSLEVSVLYPIRARTAANLLLARC